MYVAIDNGGRCTNVSRYFLQFGFALSFFFFLTHGGHACNLPFFTARCSSFDVHRYQQTKSLHRVTCTPIMRPTNAK